MTSNLCVAAYKAWKKQRSEEAREALRIAYEAIPEHLRIYVLGDMDRRDLPIRKVIYGLTEAEIIGCGDVDEYEDEFED